MKTLLNRRILAACACALGTLFFVTSCEDDTSSDLPVEEPISQTTPDLQRKIDFLRSTGFEQDSIVYSNKVFYIHSDVMISEKDIDRRMGGLNNEGARTEQRKWQYIVDDQKVKDIKVAFQTGTIYDGTEAQSGLAGGWEDAFTEALQVWNQVAGSTVKFRKVDYSSDNHDIRIYSVNGGVIPAVAAADLPLSTLDPGPEIKVTSYAYSYISYEAKLRVAIHELGHTIGLTHTDEISNDGPDSQISGTPALGQDSQSIMNAAFNPNSSNQITVLSLGDQKAAQILYPAPHIYSNLEDDYKWYFRFDFPGNYNYSWDFGDGTTAVTSTDYTKHQYVCTRRDYTVQVSALDKNTGSEIMKNSIVVTAKHDGGGEQPLQFSSRLRDDYKLRFSVTGGAGCYGNKYFHWDFGDGSTAVTQEYSIVHQYPNIRTYYTVTVSTKDGAGNLLTAPVSKTVLSKKDS